jgi:hypothetical protein
MFNETKKIIQSAESLLIDNLRKGTPKFIDFLTSASVGRTRSVRRVTDNN